MWSRFIAATVAVGLWSAFSSLPAHAEIFSTAGLYFSDELGGFRLISVSGSGSTSDPIVVVEEITELGPAVLVIRGTQLVPTDQVPDFPVRFVHLAVIKVVINSTRRVWAGFDLELQQELNKPSPYGDGLSFDQMGNFAEESFQSDSFSFARHLEEPYDRVQFYDGSVDPGAAVRFNLFITDPTPASEFFLLQEPHLIVAERPDSFPQLAATAYPDSRSVQQNARR